MGRAVPALAKQAHSEGVAHFPQHGAQNIAEHQHIIVHQKQLAALAVLKGVLVTDTEAVSRIVKPRRVNGFARQPELRLKHPAALAQTLPQIMGDVIGRNRIVA